MTETTKRQLYKALKNAAFFAAYVFVFVCLWAIACAAVKNEYLLPPLSSIIKQTGRLLGDSFFYSSFSKSMIRVFKAFALSFLSALIFAVIAYLLPLFEKLFAPIVAVLRALPTMAVILIILIFTSPYKAPVVVAFLALFPMLYTGIYSGLSTVDQKIVEACKLYRVPIWKQIWQAYLPTALPHIVREAAGGISFALKLVVSAEVLANTFVSLGGMIQLSRLYFETPKTFALTFLVVAVGLAFELVGIALAHWAERRVK